MKRLALVTALVLLLYAQLRAQITDFSGLKSVKLENGLTVLMFRDTLFPGVVLKFYAKYPVIHRKSFIGADRVFASMTGGQSLGQNLYKRTIITDSAGLDSSLRFLRYVIFDKKYSQADFRFSYLKLKKQRSLYDKAAKILVFGRAYYLASPLSQFLTVDTVLRFRNLLSADHSVVLIYGNFKPDTALSLVKQSFANLPSYKLRFGQQKIRGTGFSLNFVDVPLQQAKPAVGLAKPVEYNFARNFLEINLLKAFFKVRYPGSVVHIDYSDFTSLFYAFVNKQDLKAGFEEMRRQMKRFSQGNIDQADFLSIKDTMEMEFLYWMKSPDILTDLIYYVWHYDLPRDYVRKYYFTIRALKPADLKKLRLPDLYDSTVYILIGERQRYSCDLLELSKNYRIYVEDKDIYRYDVIPKGFNARMIIDNYLKFVAPAGTVKNLSYKYEGFLFTDTSFVPVFGYVLRKKPDLYKFLMYVRLGRDTFLLYKSQYNGRQWYDSTMLERLKPDTLRATKNYIFVEKYYKKLGYVPDLICDPALMAAGIYKIKVTTPDGFYYYDYYDNAQKIKLYTQVFSGGGKWLKTYYYYDYQRVKLGKQDIKVPFLIREQTPYYTLEMHLTAATDKNIPKYVFSYR